MVPLLNTRCFVVFLDVFALRLFCLESCALDDGVRVLLQKTPDTATGTCAVLINGGERSLVANLAAANTFNVSHLDSDDAKEAIDSCRIAYISGFFLTVSVDSILRVGKHCAENAKVFCMNLSAPFLIQFFGDQMAAAMPYTDYGEHHHCRASPNCLASLLIPRLTALHHCPALPNCLTPLLMARYELFVLACSRALPLLLASNFSRLYTLLPACMYVCLLTCTPVSSVTYAVLCSICERV